VEPRALRIAEAAMRDPVGEGEATARDEHAPTFGEHRGLVADVEQAFLAHAHIEGMSPNGQDDGMAADEHDPPVETDVVREPRGGRRAACVQLDADDTAATPRREKSRRTGEPRAHVEDPRGLRHAGAAREGVHRADAAVVVLIEVEEIVGGETVDAVASGGRPHVRLVDRVAVVEVDGRSRSLKPLASYDRTQSIFHADRWGNHEHRRESRPRRRRRLDLRDLLHRRP
jgi:hypothetical protein